MPKPGEIGCPRPTHQWLGPVIDYINLLGAVVTPSGSSGIGGGVGVGGLVPITQLGNATGFIGFYGATGGTQLPTGLNSVLGTSSVGNSGVLSVANGGSGTYYNENDIVLALKLLGILKP